MTDAALLLQAYDEQLRAAAEVPNAQTVTRMGPLLIGDYGSRGFITYRDLAGYDRPEDGARLDDLISGVVAYLEGRPDWTKTEWKTRGHDAPADLPARLVAAGFVAEDPETVMVGEAAALAVDVPLPEGYRLRRVDSEADVIAACEVDRIIFDDDPEDTAAYVSELLGRFRENPDSFELWVVEHTEQSGADGAGPTWEIVCCGRLDPVDDSEFAGIWGGGCLVEHRGKGLYRALTAARARSALDRGKLYIQSDCTEFSRPILQRSGLVPVTTTTPYIWRPATHTAAQ